MAASDFDALIKALVALFAGVVVPWAILAYQTRTGVQLTELQRAAVDHAAKTAAGIVETMLDQGTLKLASVTPNNPQILKLAQAAVDRVPDAASAQHTSPEAMAAIVVGLANTAPAAAATVPLTGAKS